SGIFATTKAWTGNSWKSRHIVSWPGVMATTRKVCGFSNHPSRFSYRNPTSSSYNLMLIDSRNDMGRVPPADEKRSVVGVLLPSFTLLRLPATVSRGNEEET